jgi:hypothetical protein
MTEQALQNRPNRRCPPRTFGMRLRGSEWQVHHGNRILDRFTGPNAEGRAEVFLRRKMNLPPAVLAGSRPDFIVVDDPS